MQADLETQHMRLPLHSLALIVTCGGVLFCGIPPVLSPTNPNTSEELVFRRTHSGISPNSKLHPVVMPDGGLVVSVDDTVYRVDADDKLVWKYSTPGGEELTSEPVFNPDLNEIAVVGFDLLFVRLDATSGKAKWQADSVGRSGFSNVVPYGRGYLVLV